jgi:hypothetical protein
MSSTYSTDTTTTTTDTSGTNSTTDSTTTTTTTTTDTSGTNSTTDSTTTTTTTDTSGTTTDSTTTTTTGDTTVSDDADITMDDTIPINHTNDTSGSNGAINDITYNTTHVHYDIPRRPACALQSKSIRYYLFTEERELYVYGVGFFLTFSLGLYLAYYYYARSRQSAYRHRMTMRDQ